MSLRSEVLALAFGVFVVLIVFGDSHLTGYIGNLDTIFGVTYWKLVDVFYPVGAIAVFLLYGKTKGGLRINVLTIAMGCGGIVLSDLFRHRVFCSWQG